LSTSCDTEFGHVMAALVPPTAHKCLALLYPYSNRCTPYYLASFPGAWKKLERSAWCSLFIHARLPRFFWGTWKPLWYWSVLHDHTLLNHGSHYISTGHVLYAFGKVGKPGMVLKDEHV